MICMEIVNFSKVNKDPVICSFSIKYPSMGYTIHDFRLMRTNGTEWVAMPSRQYQDETGKKKYFQFLQFETPDKKKNFEFAVMTMLKSFMDYRAPEELPF